MSLHSMTNFKWPDLTRPGGERITLNRSAFVAVDRHHDITYDPIYRPQALYHRALEGLHANNGALLLQEVATNLPIYLEDTGPTDFHLHLPPGGFQLVVVTSGMFTFDYDGKLHYVGPGAVILQSAIVHRQMFYTWSGLPTDQNLKTPQSVVPDYMGMGYSGKFLEAFITDPKHFPNPTVVGPEQINENETPRTAWKHPLHNRPAGADFWYQDPLALDALFRSYPLDEMGALASPVPAYVRDLGIEAPSGNLVTGHIIATDPLGSSVLPKSAGLADAKGLAKGEVVIYRMIRGSATFSDISGKSLELAAGDTVTAGGGAIRLTEIGEDTQILRLGLLEAMEDLHMWTPTQCDDVNALAGQIITRTDLRRDRLNGAPVGYLYE